MNSKLLGLAAAVSALTLAAGSAPAATYLFAVSGSNGTEGVDAQADITIDAFGATIILTNLFANPTSIASEIAGIQLFLDDAPTTSSLTGASGGELAFFKAVVCNGKKSCTPSAAHVDDVTDGVIGHWGSATGANWLSVATANSGVTNYGAAGGGPFDLIVGPGPYTNFNSSIPGDNPHINQVGTFTLAFTGLEGAPKITGVNFLFGTNAAALAGDGGCTGNCAIITGGVPEPATWAMMIMGFGAVGALLRRRRYALA